MVLIIDEVLEKARGLTWEDLDIPNGFARYVFDLIKNKKITDNEYKQIFDEIQKQFPDEIKKYVGQRKDRRTLGGFALYIYKNAAISKFWFTWWWDKFGGKHYPDQKWECNGIESEGALVFFADRKEFKEPDFILSSGGKLELKLDPVSFKFTYKENDLKHYSSIESDMLTLCFSNDVPVLYTIASPEQQKEMLKIESTKRQEVGDKPAVQFYYDLSEERIKKMGSRLSKYAQPMENFVEIHLI
jgi:hypothetical protein